MIDSVSRIELAKALKAIQAVTAPEQFAQIFSIISPAEDASAIQRAISGLSEEDEFALLCRLMGTATHLAPLEQRPIIHNDSIAPDFLARFHLGPPPQNLTSANSSSFCCFVEVKSTEDERFKIGGSNLRKRRAFADVFGFPLLIAVRFLRAGHHALWAIVHDSDRSATSLTITPQDALEGVRPIIWHEFGYLLRPRLYFEAEFDAEHADTNVIHPEFGTQREFRVVGDHATLPLTGEAAFFVSMMFEAFDLVQSRVERQGTRTTQRLEPRTPQLFLADLVFRMNRQLREESGELVYNASKSLARLDMDAERYLVTRQFVESLIGPLIVNGFVFLGTLQDPTKQAQTRDYLLESPEAQQRGNSA